MDDLAIRQKCQRHDNCRHLLLSVDNFTASQYTESQLSSQHQCLLIASNQSKDWLDAIFGRTLYFKQHAFMSSMQKNNLASWVVFHCPWCPHLIEILEKLIIYKTIKRGRHIVVMRNNIRVGKMCINCSQYSYCNDNYQCINGMLSLHHAINIIYWQLRVVLINSKLRYWSNILFSKSVFWPCKL